MFDGTFESLTSEYRQRRLIKEWRWKPTKAELERLTQKYRLWGILHHNESNCKHCIFNHHRCTGANKHYEGFGACHAFLKEGNYIK
ncbi:MAG: hypothetical protein WC495_04985 [Patescibacteria group bacterium]|jgi:hypothetical protein